MRVKLPVRLAVLACAALALYGCAAPPPPKRPAPSVVIQPPPPDGVAYVIQPGDTLYSIARRHGVQWGDILDANRALDPRDLPIGQTITIPRASIAPPPPEPVMPGAPTPPGEPHFMWPLRGEVFSKFGRPMAWRMREANQGIDIRAVPGQLVFASRGGKVNTFTSVYGYGKVVAIEHPDGTVTLYAHLDDILAAHGATVQQGEPIGKAGSTGQASGTSLHFRIMRGEKFIDPLPLLR